MAFPRISGTSDVYLELTSTSRREPRKRFGDEHASNTEDYLDGLNNYIIYDQLSSVLLFSSRVRDWRLRRYWILQFVAIGSVPTYRDDRMS